MNTSVLKTLLIFIIALLFVTCATPLENKSYVQFVDPLIGTAPSTTINALKHGEAQENNAQVVPYVTAPFGMTNWTPQTRATETKCVAPYYYKDSVIQGFRGSHWLSGSCVQDYGSMTIMPVLGELKCRPEDRGSFFSHKNEKATPYHYRVHLKSYDIDVEMTATKRCGLLKFTFGKAGKAHVLVEPNSDEGQGFIQIIPEKNEIIGYNPVHRIYQGWGERAGFKGYFVVHFDHDFDGFGTYQDSIVFDWETQLDSVRNLGGFASFHVAGNEVIYATVGTSFTSIDEARKNLELETANLDFKTAKSTLKNTWGNLLSKIEVEGKNEDDKVKFYTALYHCFLQPRTFNDCDGSYVSFAGGDSILNAGQQDYFVDFSMWDTYRSLHPLFNLLIPETNAAMMRSLLLKAREGGWLPIFPCWNSYTSAMIGDHAIASISDAYLKGVINLTDEDYKYLLRNAFDSPADFQEYENGKGRRALGLYLKYGFIPMEDGVKESFHKNEQVSRTLEYAFDDFALSQVAQKMGDSAHAEILEQRAGNYRNVYSSADSCVRGRFADGHFTDKFNKFVREPYITEGTPYQYTWYVPQDIAGLIKLMGGDQGFNANLDHFFATGQYWHGNEPGHQIPFLYNYTGEPWKTQKLVSQIMNEEYGIGSGGLSGNDDAGQMSAWYVFAAMGFYPVCPSVPQYVISGPHFDKIIIHLENGNQLVINAPGASIGKNYIQKLKLNGLENNRNFLNHFDLIKGGRLEFEMSGQPDKSWGVGLDDRPYSLSRNE